MRLRVSMTTTIKLNEIMRVSSEWRLEIVVVSKDVSTLVPM